MARRSARYRARHVGDALEGYADDMLSDLVFFVEREIESGIDGGR